MADDVLASFLVALGFKVDTASQSAATKSVADYEKAVKDAEKRIEDAKWAAAQTDEEIAKLTRETNLKLAREALDEAKAREKAEQDQVKKRKERAAEFVTSLNQMALAAAAAATAIGYAVAKVAGSFDNLYFQAQRSGTSVQSLKALGYAFSQTGGTAQQASAAVDSFTTALRNNPGLRQFVKDLGVDENLQGVDKLLATVEALNNEPQEIAVQHAGMLGISEQDYNLLRRQMEAVKAYRAEYDETSKRIGLNSDEAAQAATSFQRTLTRVQATISALGDKLLIQLAPALERVAKGFTDWMAANPEKVDHILTGISNAIVWLTEKITALVEWFGGSDGEAFMKRWDEFASRVSAIAHGFEVVWGVLKDIDGWLETSTIWRFLKAWSELIISGRFGLGGLIQDRLFGAGGGGANGAPAGAPVGGASAPGPSADVPDNRRWYEKVLPNSMGGKPAPGKAQIGNWWTPERQQHAIDALVKGGVAELGAKALVARWSAVEAPAGPTSVNPRSGAFGIGQWLSADRLAPIKGNTDFDAQLAHSVKELQTTERAALAQLNSAKTPSEAARGASMYERAEGYDRKTGTDNFTDKTEVAMGLLGQAPKEASNTPGVPSTAGVTDISERANYNHGKLDSVQGFIVHHTGGRGTPESVVNTLNQRGLGVQYVMDRDGKVFQTLPDGARGAHLRPAENGSGLNNSNSLGMEVIAKDDNDITPAQVASAKMFLSQLERQYPGLKVFGHGEVNAHKQETEGQTIVDAFRKMTPAERTSASASLEDQKAAAAAESVRSAAKAVKSAADGIVVPKPVDERKDQPAPQAQKAEAPRDDRTWFERHAPALLGGKDAPAAKLDLPKEVASTPTAQPRQDRPIIVPPAMNPAGFDPNRIDPHDLAKPAAPLGANSVTNSTSNDNRAVHQTFNNTTTIHEARNTREAGRVMESTFNRMHGMALENAQSAVA